MAVTQLGWLAWRQSWIQVASELKELVCTTEPYADQPGLEVLENANDYLEHTALFIGLDKGKSPRLELFFERENIAVRYLQENPGCPSSIPAVFLLSLNADWNMQLPKVQHHGLQDFDSAFWLLEEACDSLRTKHLFKNQSIEKSIAEYLSIFPEAAPHRMVKWVVNHGSQRLKDVLPAIDALVDRNDSPRAWNYLLQQACEGQSQMSVSLPNLIV